MTKRFALGLLVVAMLGVTARAQAQTFQVRGYLNGSNEEPPIQPSTGAFGWITCDVNATTEVATCRATFYNIPGGITLSHFHAGNERATGPVVCNATPQTPVTASNDGAYNWTCNSTVFQANAAAGIRSMRDLIEALSSGALYFNIHTTEHGGGEIRGQVCPVLGPNEHNPVTGAELCSYPKP